MSVICPGPQHPFGEIQIAKRSNQEKESGKDSISPSLFQTYVVHLSLSQQWNEACLLGRVVRGFGPEYQQETRGLQLPWEAS